MDSRTFLGLRATHNPFRWSMEVVPGLSAGGMFLFGGAGLAAAISALEGTSGRQTIWATSQYLSFARPGEHLDIDVTLAVEGHQMTQARAVCHVGNREILTVNAALGDRSFDRSGQWVTAPSDVPAARDCPARPMRADQAGSINERLEMRVVKFRDPATIEGAGDGHTIAWARLPEGHGSPDAAALAVLGDFVPMGVGQALGIAGGGQSLDNTLRLARLVPTEWVLLDIHVQAVERGFGHGHVNMFAEDGTLLAVASQSCIVRYWKNRPDALARDDERRSERA